MKEKRSETYLSIVLACVKFESYPSEFMGWCNNMSRLSYIYIKLNFLKYIIIRLACFLLVAIKVYEVVNGMQHSREQSQLKYFQNWTIPNGLAMLTSESRASYQTSSANSGVSPTTVSTRVCWTYGKIFPWLCWGFLSLFCWSGMVPEKWIWKRF